MKGNYVAFDSETGGLNAKTTSLLSLGFVFIKDGEIVNQLEFTLKHDIYKVTAEALKVNKINIPGHDVMGIPVSKAIDDFKDAVKKAFGSEKPTVIGHNVGFDLGFVHEQFMPKEEWEKYVSYRNVDTAGIARFLMAAGVLNIKKNGLSNILEHYNHGSESSEGRHTALWDAINTWKAYSSMHKDIQHLAKRNQYLCELEDLGGTDFEGWCDTQPAEKEE